MGVSEAVGPRLAGLRRWTHRHVVLLSIVGSTVGLVLGATAGFYLGSDDAEVALLSRDRAKLEDLAGTLEEERAALESERDLFGAENAELQLLADRFDEREARLRAGAERLDDRAAALKKREKRLEARAADVRQATAELRSEQERIQQTSIRDGIWQVGVDIEPGLYRSQGGANCYWALLRSADTQAIINNGGFAPNQTLRIDSPWFQTNDCGRWTKLD